jgi:hypothetical protein
MAYDKEVIIKQAIEEINSRKLTTIEELVAFLPISSATFYNWELEKLEAIKEPLFKMKVLAKKAMKNKWYGSENPTLQLAWFKLHASPEELSALSMNKVEHSGEVTTTVIFQEVEVKSEYQDDGND